MNIKDVGIVIAKKHLQEKSYIITVFTKSHGLYSGVITNITAKTLPTYLPGNLIDFTWQARLHSHLGILKGELVKSYYALFFNDKTKILAFNSIISLIKITFHEREPHNNFFPILIDYLGKMNGTFSFYDYIQLELNILAETGYKLSLEECGVSRSTENLKYVSPKTGKAISQTVGDAYANKLLKLPNILTTKDFNTSAQNTRECFELTNYFFYRYFKFTTNAMLPRLNFIEFICNEKTQMYNPT